MATTQSQLSPQQWLARQFLAPLEDALALARRYRQLDAFRDYLAARWTLVAPVCLLLLVTALACAARGEAAYRGYPRLEAQVVDHPIIQHALARAGYTWHGGMFIYEMAL